VAGGAPFAEFASLCTGRRVAVGWRVEAWSLVVAGRPHQGIAQRIPDGEHGGDHLTVADLGRERICRKPILGGLINEYSCAA
jgi:hypothetical protein